MQKILSTTLATAFAAVCLAGASVTFAADNGGKDKGKDANATNNNMAGDKNPKDNKCADDNSATNAGADCTTEPMAEQPQ
jgi:hypothetical protein